MIQKIINIISLLTYKTFHGLFLSPINFSKNDHGARPINKEATESSETLKFVFKKNKVYMVVLAPNLSIRTIRFFFSDQNFLEYNKMVSRATKYVTNTQNTCTNEFDLR